MRSQKAWGASLLGRLKLFMGLLGAALFFPRVAFLNFIQSSRMLFTQVSVMPHLSLEERVR